MVFKIDMGFVMILLRGRYRFTLYPPLLLSPPTFCQSILIFFPFISSIGGLYVGCVVFSLRLEGGEGRERGGWGCGYLGTLPQEV